MHHIADVHEIVMAFHAREPIVVERDIDSNSRMKCLRARFREALPVEVATLVGDAIHNMRAALDVLAVDLARRNGVTSLNKLRQIKFPIASSRAHFETGGDGQGPALNAIKSLAGADITTISGFKPYRGGNDAFWQLQQLDNLDKHSLIVPTVAALKETVPTVVAFPPPGHHVEFKLGHINKCPVGDGDALLYYPPNQPDEAVSLTATFAAALYYPGIIEGQHLLPTLRDFGDLVDQVLETCEASNLS